MPLDSRTLSSAAQQRPLRMPHETACALCAWAVQVVDGEETSTVIAKITVCVFGWGGVEGVGGPGRT